MRQKGTVIEKDGDYAVVSVKRMSACDACHKRDPGMQTAGESPCQECSMFPVQTEFSVRAYDEIGVEVGMCVEVECESSRVLGYAAAVFLLPLLLAFLGGACGVLFFSAPWITYGLAGGGFLLAFVFVKLVVDKTAREKTEYRITSML